MSPRQPTKEKAGVVAYRHDSRTGLCVLVVSTRKTENQWVFPVGSVKKNERLADAARRECQEESGYHVNIGAKLSAVRTKENGRPIRFTFFLATVTGESDRWETDRKRRWLPVSQLVAALPDIFKDVAREAVSRI